MMLWRGGDVLLALSLGSVCVWCVWDSQQHGVLMPALSSSKHLVEMGPSAALGLLHSSLSRQFLIPGANGGCERRWWQGRC